MEHPLKNIGDAAKKIVDPIERGKAIVDLAGKTMTEAEKAANKLSDNKNNRWLILVLVIIAVVVSLLAATLMQSIKNGQKITETKQATIDAEKSESKDLYKELYLIERKAKDSLAHENAVIKEVLTQAKVTISRQTQIIEYLNSKK